MDSLRFLMKDDLRVYAYMVLLENYLHLVVQNNNLNCGVARFKSYITKPLVQYLTNHNAKQILQQLAFYKKAHKDDRAHQFWQEGCHPERFKIMK